MGLLMALHWNIEYHSSVARLGISWMLLFDEVDVIEVSDADLFLPSICGMFWRSAIHSASGILDACVDQRMDGVFYSYLKGKDLVEVSGLAVLVAKVVSMRNWQYLDVVEGVGVLFPRIIVQIVVGEVGRLLATCFTEFFR